MKEMTLNIRSIVLILISIVSVFVQIPWAMADAYDDLLEAVRSNDIVAAEALFARGMDVNTTDAGGDSLLMISVKRDHADMAQRLLTRQANPDARNQYGETALMLAAAAGNLNLAKLLVHHGAKVNLAGWNPLIYAAWRGRTEVAKFLLDQGADIDAVAPNGISALMMAARGGPFDTVKLLLWEVADPNLKTDSGGTALAWAMKEGNTEIADLLKQAGAKE